jgi:hypothetical protein
VTLERVRLARGSYEFKTQECAVYFVATHRFRVGCWGRRSAARASASGTEGREHHRSRPRRAASRMRAVARGFVALEVYAWLRFTLITVEYRRYRRGPRAASQGALGSNSAVHRTRHLDTPAPMAMPPETASAFDSADLPRDGHSSLYLRSCSYLLFVLWFGSGEGGRRSILASRLDTSSSLFL